MEARGGIEPPYTGFADPCITTLLPRRKISKLLIFFYLQTWAKIAGPEFFFDCDKIVIDFPTIFWQVVFQAAS